MSSASAWIDARHTSGAIAAIMLLVLQVGCVPCKPDSSHCDGDSLYHCQGSADAPSYSWYVERCAGTCISLDGDSFCATERTTSADCAAADNAEHCADNAVVRCHKGYRTAAESCGTGACVPAAEQDDGAFCALSADLDPKCEGRPQSACDGSLWITCRGGHRTGEVPCPTGASCQIGETVAASGTYPVGLCALDPTPDPRCREDLFLGQDSHCDGQVLTSCYAGYIVMVQECAPMIECFRHDAGWGECLGPTVSSVGDPYGAPPHSP